MVRGIGAVGSRTTQPAAVAYRSKPFLLRSTPDRSRVAPRSGGVFGFDVHDPVHGVGAPQRGAWAADDLDAIHLL